MGPAPSLPRAAGRLKENYGNGVEGAKAGATGQPSVLFLILDHLPPKSPGAGANGASDSKKSSGTASVLPSGRPARPDVSATHGGAPSVRLSSVLEAQDHSPSPRPKQTRWMHPETHRRVQRSGGPWGQCAENEAWATRVRGDTAALRPLSWL